MSAPRTPGRLASLIVLGTSLACAAVVTWHVQGAHRDRERERFTETAIEVSAEITRRLDASIAMLDATTGLFAASEYVSRDEFRRFVDQLDLKRNYSGVISIGFAEKPVPGEESGVAARIGREHGPEAATRALSIGADGFAVVYVEPMTARDASQIGADLSQNPLLRGAIAQACESGAPALSGRNRSGHASQAGALCDFFIVAPIYRSTDGPKTPDERRRLFAGVVGARVCSETLLSDVLAALQAPAEFAVAAPGGGDANERMFASPGFDQAERRRDRPELVRTISVADASWTARFLPSATFGADAAVNPTTLVAILGTVISLLLYGLMRMQSLATIRSERDAEALRASQRQAMESEARKSAILESAIDAIVTMDHEGHVLEWNAAAERMLGWTRDQALGASLADLMIPEADRQRHREGLLRFLRTGDGVLLGRRVETTAVRADGVTLPVELSITRIGDSIPPRFTGFIRDNTERDRADRQRRLMTRELDHRVKNNLFAVMAILSESARRTDSVSDLVESVSGRLHALARLHELLANHAWESADLHELLSITLAPYRDGSGPDANGAPERVELQGPPIVIPARTASTLCIALHELATNAAKYGSLSTSDGRVRVSWRTEDSGSDSEKLHLRWEERGGPAVSTPQRRGFGSDLIEGGVRFETDGACQIRFDPDGVVCDIETPLRPPPARTPEIGPRSHG